jgi:hypothetical protein
MASSTKPQRRSKVHSQKTGTAKPVRNWDGGEYVKVRRQQLKFAPYNPRVMDQYAAKGLKESIKSTKGLIEPVVWNERTGNVIAGHQRLTQLDELDGGQDYEVTVVKLDVSETEERRLNIILNNPTIQGAYDLEKLFALLAPDAEFDLDLVGTGFDVTTLELMAQNEGFDLPAWMVPEQERQTADEYEQVAEDVEATLDAADDAKADTKEQERIADFKRKKATFREKAAFDADAQVYLRLVFATSAQLDAFLEATGVPAEAGGYLDGIALARRFDVDLNAVESSTVS